MELFEVFIKIAVNAEEINKKLDKIFSALKDFADTCEEVCKKANDAFERVSDGFTTMVGKLATMNTLIAAFKNFKDIFIFLGKNIGKVYKAFKMLGKGIMWLGKKVVALGKGAATLGKKLLILLGPKGLIIAAIVALVGYFVNLIRNNEEVQAKLIAIWDKIKDFFKDAFTFIKNLVQTVFGTIQNVIYTVSTTISGIISTLWNTVTGIFQTAFNGIQAALQAFVTFFTNKWQGAWNLVQNIGTSFMTSITNILGGIVNIGRNLIYGLWNGINAMKQWISNKITGFFSSGVLGSVARFLGINSPSRVFADKVGKSIVQGVAEGIDKEAYTAEEAAIAMAEAMVNPQIEIYELGFLEIAEIVIKTLEEMARKAIQVIRAMTARMDAHINEKNRKIKSHMSLCI